MNRARRPWHSAPLATLFALDVALTLIGQPATYWAGDRRSANEANPLAYALLAIDPWLFAGAALVWCAALGAVFAVWTSRLSRAIAMAVAAAHALGGSGWLLRSGEWGVALAGGYLVLAAQLCLWCWAKGREPDRPDRR